MVSGPFILSMKTALSNRRRKFLKSSIFINGGAILQPGNILSFTKGDQIEDLKLIKNGLIVNHNGQFIGDILG